MAYQIDTNTSDAIILLISFMTAPFSSASQFLLAAQACEKKFSENGLLLQLTGAIVMPRKFLRFPQLGGLLSSEMRKPNQQIRRGRRDFSTKKRSGGSSDFVCNQSQGFTDG
jgi:hypothetical protein